MSDEKPRIRIGKNGVSQQVLGEIDSQLERAEKVKVRILKAALKGSDARDIAEKVAQQTESILLGVKGHTFQLYREERKAQD